MGGLGGRQDVILLLEFFQVWLGRDSGKQLLPPKLAREKRDWIP
jgi:hypothetical protein